VLCLRRSRAVRAGHAASGAPRHPHGALPIPQPAESSEASGVAHHPLLQQLPEWMAVLINRCRLHAAWNILSMARLA
jgi:hypothetical protein